MNYISYLWRNIYAVPMKIQAPLHNGNHGE